MNILVLDGGGSKGLASARFIQQMEQAIGPVGQNFDMVCGVSTGAILGTMLARGISGTVASELYTEMLPKIFQPRGWRLWRGLLSPKYPEAPLEHELEFIWKNDTLGDLELDTMILASKLCPIVGPKVWKSWDPKDKALLVRDLVRASAAAPVYFSPHTIGKEVYVDGGLCTNEPSMCALAEAVRRSGTVAQHKLLTIRCGGTWGYTQGRAERRTVPVRWVPELLDVMFQCSERVSEYECHQLLGFASHVVELGVSGGLDQTGEGFNQQCAQQALEAWGMHRQAIQNRFGTR